MSEQEKKRKEEDEKRRRGEAEKTEDKRQKTEENQSKIDIPSTLNPGVHPQGRTQPSTCNKFAPELKAYQDGQLGWGARLRVRRHVANCAHCREEMQAMREFSQFLQGGEGETLPPQLRARILAAVPDTVPAASSTTRVRALSRPVLAWGAVASALILCILLTPLFLTKDQEAMRTANTSAPTATAPAPMAASKAAADGSAGASMAGSRPGAAKSDNARIEMKAASPSVSAAAPAAPRQEPFAADGARMLAGKPAATTVTPTDKSAAADSAAPAGKSMAEPQYRMSVKQSANFGRSVSLAQGESTPQKAASVMPPSPAARAEKAQASQKAVAAKAKTVERGKREDEDILLMVADVEQTRATLEQTVKNNGGVVAAFKNTPSENSDSAATVTLEVPAARLPALLSELDALRERKPFVPAPISRRTPPVSAPGAFVNGVNSANKTANFRDNSGRPPQSQNVAPSRPRAQRKPDADTLPSSPASAKPKSPVQLEPPEPKVRVTIHLQEKPKG